MSNPSDIKYSINREAVAGTTNATPAFVTLEVLPGSDLSYDMKMLSNEVVRANRDAAGYRKIAGSVGGSLKTQLRRDTAWDMLIESGLSGAFVSGVAKGGSTDFFHTIEKKMSGDAAPEYFRYRGVQVSKFGITVDAESNAEVSVDFVGMGRDLPSTTALAGSTYAEPTRGTSLTGIDVATISIGALTLDFVSLDMSVEHTRNAKFALGKRDAIGVGTSGVRMVKMTFKAYRTDVSADTLFASDTPVPVSVTLGSGANGYRFDCPAMVGSIPKDETSGSSALITIELMAQRDDTAGFAISCTKLA